MAAGTTDTHNSVRKMLYGRKGGQYTVISRESNIDMSTDEIDFDLPTSRSDVIRGRVTLKSGEAVDLSDKGVKTLLQRANINQRNVKKVIILRHPKTKQDGGIRGERQDQPSTSHVKQELGWETLREGKSISVRSTATGIAEDKKLANVASVIKYTPSTSKSVAARTLKAVAENEILPTKSISAIPDTSNKYGIAAASRSMMNKFTLQKIPFPGADVKLEKHNQVGNFETESEIGGSKLAGHHDDHAARQQAMNDSLTNINWLGGASINPDLEISMQEKQRSKTKLHIKESSHERPSYSYMSMIQFAISSKTDKKMTLQEIYHWIETNFPYFKTAKLGWKNSIRHNLSLHDIFIREKAQEAGKPSFWKLKEEPKQRAHTPVNYGYLPANPVIGPPGMVYSPVYTSVLPSSDPDSRKTGFKSKNPPILPRLTQSYAIIPIPLVVQTATSSNTPPVLAPAPSITVAPQTTRTTILPANPGKESNPSTSVCLSGGRRKRDSSQDRQVVKKVKIAPKVSVYGDNSYAEVSLNSSNGGNVSTAQSDLCSSVDSGMESQISEAEQSQGRLSEAQKRECPPLSLKINRCQSDRSKQGIGQSRRPKQNGSQPTGSGSRRKHHQPSVITPSHKPSIPAKQSSSLPRLTERSRPIILRSRKFKKGKPTKETQETENVQENLNLDSYLSEFMQDNLEELDSSTLKFLTKTPPRNSKTLTSTPNKKLTSLSPGVSPLVGITPLKMLENLDSGTESLSEIRLPFGLSPVRGNFSTPGKDKTDGVGMDTGLGITPEKMAGVDCIDGPLDFQGTLFGSPKLGTPGRVKLENQGSLKIGSLSELGLAGLTPLKDQDPQNEHNHSFMKFLNEFNLSGYMSEDELDLGNLSWGALES